MKSIHLIVVGKLKEKNILSLEHEYLKRLKNPGLSVHEVKSHSENLDLEAKEVVKKVSDLAKEQKARIILLAEVGKQMDSRKFAKWFGKKIEGQGGPLVFVIGGAAGHGKEILDSAEESISLSAMTFPHKLARLILVEQIYRAQTILAGHPYHK